MAKKRANGEGNIKTYLDIQNKTISVSKQYVKNPNGELTLSRPKTETSVRTGSIPQEAVAPHFDPRLKVHFYNKKAPKTEVFDASWSCWADSNRRPHPYQGCALPTELQQHIGDQEGARTLDLQRDRLAF